LIPFVRSVQALGVPELVVTSVYWGTNPMVPLTVQPGDESVTLSIVVTNTGDDFARSVRGRLELKPPFTYEYSSESGGKQSLSSIVSDAGDIAAGRSFTFQFILSIDSDAEEGVYQLPLELTYRSARELQETSETAYIDIPIWRGELHIQTVATTPPKVYPGSKQVALRVFIINSGRGAVKNLSVFLDLQDPFKASSTGSDRAFIGTVQPGQPSQLQFLLDIADNAGPGNYPLKLMANIEGSKQTAIGIIDFTVAEKARFALLSITPETIHAGDSGVTLRVTIKNVSKMKAESVRVQLMAGNYFSGTLSDLLGTVNPGEAKTAFFTVDVDGNAVPQQYTVDLRLDWTQDEVYSLNETLPLNITVAGASPPLLLIAIAVLVIAVILFGYVRRRMRRKGEAKPKA
jgi:hypothetical protein